MSTPLNILIDNPIIVKQFRSRLRLSQLVPGIVAVLAICLLFTWTTYSMGQSGTWSVYTLSVVAWLILVVGGSNQVAIAVGSAKESGILDFHRVSPLSAATLAIGFFLGAPIREYAYFAMTIPFMVLSALVNEQGLGAIVSLIAPTILTAWLVHAMAMLAALVAKNPRSASVGTIVFVLITMYIGQMFYRSGAAMRMMNSGEAVDPGTMEFFTFRIPMILFLAMYLGGPTIFLLIAAARKMRSEGALAFSKLEALACMTMVVILGLGAFGQYLGNIAATPVLLYIYVVTGIVLASTIQPDLNEYCKGVRRALRAGHRRPPVLAESASNAWGVYGLAGLVAIGATIAAEALDPTSIGSGVSFGRYSYSQTIAVGVFTVAYFGLGRQYFALKFNRKSVAYFRLFLFLIWILPLLVGVAAGISSMGSKAVQIAMGVSPWAGMVLSIKGLQVADSDAADVVRFMALLPSLTFAFLFHFLLINEQRRIDLRLRETAKPASRDLSVA